MNGGATVVWSRAWVGRRLLPPGAEFECWVLDVGCNYRGCLCVADYWGVGLLRKHVGSRVDGGAHLGGRLGALSASRQAIWFVV